MKDPPTYGKNILLNATMLEVLVFSNATAMILIVGAENPGAQATSSRLWTILYSSFGGE